MSRYIGLMSGTSIDGIDAALVHFDSTGRATLEASHSHELPENLREDLLALCQPGDNEIERMGRADRQLGHCFATATNTLLEKAGRSASDICAIGSHGQTIRHRPELGDEAFSLQIGDPNTIAENTGIAVIADFRRRDIAAGGQGAPLVPPFHADVFGAEGRCRAIVNIGGIANVSVLDGKQLRCGFDTGPGNGLMDAWIQANLGERYDNNGQWAASGTINAALLEQLLQHPYFAQASPKSTGREDFHIGWLEQQLAKHGDIPAADVQASLLALSAHSIVDAIKQQSPAIKEVYLCGGGAFNGQLIAKLEALLHPLPLANTTALAIAPDWVEAAAFAWLAKQHCEGLPGNAVASTGAKGPRVLGSRQA